MNYLKRKIIENQNLIIIGLLIVLGFSLYANTFNNQMFWDDDDFILKNQYVHNFSFGKFFSENLIAGSGLVSNYWRPALLTVFSLEWHIWQDWTPGFHFVNTSMHIINVLLLFFLLTKIFAVNFFKPTSPPHPSLSSRGEGGKTIIVFFTALLFLIHPLQTEAVTYVNSLGDSLSVLFMLLGLRSYLLYTAQADKKSDSLSYIYTNIYFILALMSKETAIVFPALVFLVDFFQTKNQNLPLKTRLLNAWKNIWPILSIALIYIILRATALNFKNSFNLYNERNDYTSNIFVRVLTFFKIIIVYLKLLFYPVGLHMERSIEIATKFSWDIVFGGLVSLGLALSSLKYYKKIPIYSFGILWFFIGLAPTSNIVVPINGLLYEHWLYLPMIGFWLAICSLVYYCHSEHSACLTVGRKNLVCRSFTLFRMTALRIFVFAGILLWFGFLFVKTIERNKEWQNPITFYNQTLEYAPNNYRILNNLGMAYADAGQNDNAIKNYEKAIALDPNNPVAYHNLGNAYASIGQKEKALLQFQKALTLDPKFLFTYGQLINLYLQDKDYPNAKIWLNKLLEVQPDNEQAKYILQQLPK
jgi:tetratricopeptide (TPR) repeat protein